ncbi:hypothetical protein Tco_0678823 [Tanacetum coccineum]|uniref:Integrase, catalytic region, zinc finger, CCHC-type, peptidase aspartic, catalytic n=1 Tax=Tanacetum coccineum TaxID=301880 RepID=A0ABQ4XGC2_9ASTR
MRTIGMTMKPLQVNTNFVNHLPPEWSKFVTGVKLAKDIHATNFDYLYYHLRQHEAHANEVILQIQRYPDKIALVVNSPTCLNPTQYYPHMSSATQQYYLPPALQSPTLQQSYESHALHQTMQQSSSTELDLGLVVLSLNPTDDPVDNLNKLMAFTVQGRQTQGYANNGARYTATNQGVNRQGDTGQARVVKCYNCQEEDKRDKVVLAQASHEIPTPAEFQTNDLDAFDFDCDDVPSAKAVLMANLSSYDLDVLLELFEHGLCKELKEMKAVFNQMETEVANCSVDKKYFEIEKKELSLDMIVYLVHTAVNSLAAINDYKTMQQSFMDEYNEILVLKVELAKKNDMIEMLKAKNISIEKLKEHIANSKGKNVVDSVQHVHNSNVVTSKVYKLNFPPLSPCIKNNMVTHVDYLKHTQENADILREIIEHARELRPLDSDLASACMFVTRIQESLVYVSATCSSSKHVSDKLVVVTPMNRTKKVSSTEASGSKPGSNTKKDKITQTSSSNKKKNKVEDQHRIAKSNLNNMNRVYKTICNEDVKHSVLNVNSELICATCHECMFDAIHDLCVSDYLNDVNARVKSKFVKSRYAKSKKKKMWKPTGKVYTNVGYSWKLTGALELTNAPFDLDLPSNLTMVKAGDEG